MIKIAICDDDRFYIELIYGLVKEHLFSSIYNDFEFDIQTFTESDKLLHYLDDCSPNIVFLDIDMPVLNGFDVAERLSKDTNIIFVSSFDSFVFASIKHHPFRYLRKSHLKEEFNEAFFSALNDIISRNGYLTLDNKSFNKRIPYSDILFMENNRNYVNVVCKNNESYLYRATVSQMEERLKAHGFARCHSAFLINICKIKYIKNDCVALESGNEIKISRKYKEQFKGCYMSFLRQ